MLDLEAAAVIMADGGAAIDQWPEEDRGGWALAYAAAGWEIFPLHPWDCRCPTRGQHIGCAESEKSRGKVPYTARGVLDATDDLGQVAEWWTRWPAANIGGRLPQGVVAIDIDPRSGGLESWKALIAEHGPVHTRKSLSGRGDGGGHVFVHHPGGKLRGALAEGIDIKGHGGYVVLPPSLHAATGKPYRWVDATAPIMSPAPWLARLLRKEQVAPTRSTSRPRNTYTGDSIADWYTDRHTWNHVLEPHGWALVSGGGDDDGSRWRHPIATSAWSATIRHGCLFCYSPNTVFELTTAEEAHGYTRFRALAMLDHGGDLSEAARAAAQLRKAMAA